MSLSLRAISAFISPNPVEILLVVFFVALTFGLTAVEFFLQLGVARLGLFQFGLEHGARFAVARPLVGAVDTGASCRRPRRGRATGRWRRNGNRPRALHDGDVPAFHDLAAALLRVGRIVGVLVAAAPYALVSGRGHEG